MNLFLLWFGLVLFHKMLETQTQKVIFKLKSFNVLRRKKGAHKEVDKKK